MYNISRLNVYFSLNFMAYPTDAQCLLLIVAISWIYVPVYICLKDNQVLQHL